MSDDSRFEVETVRGVPFGTAFVNYNEGAGPFAPRSLLLDVYRPVGIAEPAPGLLMAFGGAFHRGTREDDRRPEESPVNTNIAEYCARFAARGYVCFSIDYRLTQEDSHPGFTPTMGPEPVPTSRIDVVREILGLPPATSDMLKRSQEGAIDDLTAAYRFVCGEARRFGVDPSRIGVGGFSAGGRIAVTAALAEAISPAVVVALSGVAAPSIVEQFHASDKRRMPVFLAYGEHDLDYVIPGVEAMVERFEAAGHPYQCCKLPGQTHFYESGSAVDATHGAPGSLESAIEAFLAEHL